MPYRSKAVILAPKKVKSDINLSLSLLLLFLPFSFHCLNFLYLWHSLLRGPLRGIYTTSMLEAENSELYCLASLAAISRHKALHWILFQELVTSISREFWKLQHVYCSRCGSGGTLASETSSQRCPPPRPPVLFPLWHPWCLQRLLCLCCL